MRYATTVVLLAGLAGGCINNGPEAGNLSLSLIGSSPSGNTYRLRHADLTVTGAGTTVVFHSEEHLTESTINARLPVGPYTLSVATGWSLEKLAADGSAQTVEATLTSPAPLGFDVVGGGFTPVLLQFRAGGEVVDLTQGDIGISIGIDDAPDAGPQSLIVTPATLTLPEGGAALLQVRLAAPVSTPVTVNVASADTTRVLVMPSTLTFQPGNGNVPQTVQVVAVHDADLESAMVPVTVSSPGLPAVTVAVQVLDADVQDIIVDTAAVTIPEGGSAQVGVRLAFAPPTGTIIQVASTVPAHVAVAPSVLTFTAANYSVAQLVTITADRDTDLENLSAQVLLQTGGLNRSIAVLVQDTSVAVSLGFPTYGGSTASLQPNSVHAYPVTVTSPITVTSLGLIGTGSSARMALYSGGSAPSARLLTTPSVTPTSPPGATSWSIDGLTINPGQYWLAVLGPSNLGVVPGATTTRCSYNSILGSGFPDGSSPLWQCSSGQQQANLFAAGVQ